jgi:hypothetical protein
LSAGLNYPNNVKAYMTIKFFRKFERNRRGAGVRWWSEAQSVSAISTSRPDFASLHPGYHGVTPTDAVPDALAPHFTDLRATTNLLNRINLIPPVQSHRKKYFPSRFPQIKSISLAIPSHMRGVSRSSRTLERDAVDADALWTNGAGADGEVVWS